jgi:hypothetical protein
MADSVSIDRQAPENKRTGQCLSGLVLDRLVDNSADIGTSTMAHRHIESCTYCRKKLALLKSFEAQSLQPIQADRGKGSPAFGRIALAAASLLVAVGVGVHFRQTQEFDLKGPVIYRSAQFAAISPIGSVVSAPPAFKWEAVADAATYRLSLMDVDRSEIWTVETSDTTVAAPPEVQRKMTAGRGFLWTVSARNTAGEKVSETDPQKLYISIVATSNQKEIR